MQKCGRLHKYLGREMTPTLFWVPLHFEAERYVCPNLCNVNIRFRVLDTSGHQKKVVSKDCGGGAR